MRDDGADGSGPVLVGTKLRPLTVRDQVVPRERLMERLRGGSGLGLSLVACPPGYGKTTLLAAWHEIEAARKPVAWLTLDEDDNDPVGLWSYVIEALRRVCPAVGQSSAQIVGRASIVDTVLPRLVNELDGQDEVTLILDDFHRLSDGAARQSIAWFVDHAPLSFQLVLASRTEPDLPLAALRAHGELLELRAGRPAVHLRGGRRVPERPPRARPHARGCRGLVGKTEGGRPGSIWLRSRCSSCRPPRLREQVRCLEPPRGRLPGDGGTPGA